MSFVEGIKKRVSQEFEKFKRPQKQDELNKSAKSSHEEIVENTYNQIYDLAIFLMKNTVALRALGANDADLEILEAITNPVSENMSLDFKHSRKLGTEDVWYVDAKVPTKRQGIKLGIKMQTVFFENKNDHSYIGYQAMDSGNDSLFNEGFFCYLDGIDVLESTMQREGSNKELTFGVSDKARRLYILKHSDSKNEKMDFTYIGEMDGMGVLVNVIRKNKNNSGDGGGKKKEQAKNLNAEPEFGAAI